MSRYSRWWARWLRNDGRHFSSALRDRTRRLEMCTSAERSRRFQTHSSRRSKILRPSIDRISIRQRTRRQGVHRRLPKVADAVALMSVPGIMNTVTCSLIVLDCIWRQIVAFSIRRSAQTFTLRGDVHWQGSGAFVDGSRARSHRTRLILGH